MKKSTLASFVLANLATVAAMPVFASSLELGVGSTFSRDNNLKEGAAVSAAYVNNARYPTEIAGGWIRKDGSAGSNDNVYLSVGKRAQHPNGLFAGAGLALVSETNDRVKKNLNAKLQVGYARGPVFIKAEHLTSGSGGGENLVFVGYRHRF